MEMFQAIAASNPTRYGTDFMYRCPVDGVQAILVYKAATRWPTA